MALGITHDHECRKGAAVVVQVMQFDSSFSLAEFRPGKDAEAEVNHGRIQRHERVLEPKRVMRRDRSALVE